MTLDFNYENEKLSKSNKSNEPFPTAVYKSFTQYI